MTMCKCREILNQCANFFIQMTPSTCDFDSEIISDAMVEVFEKSGERILITHSAGGALV